MPPTSRLTFDSQRLGLEAGGGRGSLPVESIPPHHTLSVKAHTWGRDSVPPLCLSLVGRALGRKIWARRRGCLWVPSFSWKAEGGRWASVHNPLMHDLCIPGPLSRKEEISLSSSYTPLWGLTVRVEVLYRAGEEVHSLLILPPPTCRASLLHLGAGRKETSSGKGGEYSPGATSPCQAT